MRPQRGCAPLVALLVAAAGLAPASAATDPLALPADPVVVATFDTGTNPFHPCFRRPGIGHPSARIPGFPADAPELRLTFRPTYDASLDASGDAIAAIEPDTLYAIQDTNLAFYGGTAASTELVDDFPHGAQASSQISCANYGLAPNALVVIVNIYDVFGSFADKLRWAAQQPWIDVLHLNVQDTPLPHATFPAIRQSVEAGKVVVVAAGNGVQGAGANYPMELSRYNRYPGTLIAGANDNGGWTYFSNLDPHIVMDGCGTIAAHPYDFGDARFGGTSSASPRVSGYVARLLGILRARFGHTGAGLVTVAGTPPAAGPLADGSLSAAELHEVIRKTADPNPHESAFDGSGGCDVPQPFEGESSWYAKMGYGEISEHTLDDALAVAAGERPMPERPMEDFFFRLSEEIREARS